MVDVLRVVFYYDIKGLNRLQFNVIEIQIKIKYLKILKNKIFSYVIKCL